MLCTQHPEFIWDSTGTPGCGGNPFKGHMKVYTHQCEGKHAGTLYTCWKANCLLYNHFTLRIASVLKPLSGCFILSRRNYYNMHLEADQRTVHFQTQFRRERSINFMPHNTKPCIKSRLWIHIHTSKDAHLQKLSDKKTKFRIKHSKMETFINPL